MKFLSSFAACMLCAFPLQAQQSDDFSVTLTTGKVLTFQSAEQKAQFLAARARTAQSPAAMAAPAAASAPGGSAPLIALDVRSMNGGTKYTINWITDYGSVDASGRTNKALDLNIKNLSATPSNVVLEWIFIGRNPNRQNRFIFDMGSHDWEMKPNQEAHLGVKSADLTNRTIYYATLGYGSYSGAEIDGWIVVVRHQGKIIKHLGSTSTLEAMVGTPDFDKMLAAYKTPAGGRNAMGVQ